MSHSHEALITRWFEEVWNQGKEETLDELLADDGVFFGFPSATESVGPADFKAAFQGFRATFSGIHITDDEVLTEGDRAAARWTATMTHSGEGLGFRATGMQVTLPGMSITHFRDGRMVKAWNSFDLTAPIAALREAAGRGVTA